MKKYILAASLFIATALCGCSSTVAKTISEPEVNTSESESNHVNLGSNLQNSILLLDQMTEKGSNAVFSPLSLNYALGLIAEGSSGQTKEEIDSYLGTCNYGDVASSYMQIVESDNVLQEEMENDTDSDNSSGIINFIGGPLREEINIANSLWVNNDQCKLLEDYRQKVQETYKATVEEMSFADANVAADKINSWCDEETRGLIPNIVNAGDLISPNNEGPEIVLANALYFESPWSGGWFPHDELEKFTLTDKSTVKTQYIYGSGDRYYENKKAFAFGSYYSNGRLFIGILPKKKGTFTLENLDIEGLLKNDKTSEYDTIYCSMPELDFGSEYDLVEPLSKLGVSSMFDPNRAAIDKIAKVHNDRPLYVGSAKQKAKIELNEKGTRAASANAFLGLTVSADKPGRSINIYLDRPYAFLIYDEEQEQVLFIGKVAIPNSKI